jgi:hypothetical protein
MRGRRWGSRTKDARALSKVKVRCHVFADGRERCDDVVRCATGVADEHRGLLRSQSSSP